MNQRVLPAFTRRTSLLSLGAAALLTPVRPFPTGAKKNRRRKKGNKGDVFKLCKKQVGPCLDFFLILCEEDDLVCQAQVEVCCAEVGQCDFTGLIVCLDGNASTSALVGPRFSP
jgi:hypothetical protein